MGALGFLGPIASVLGFGAPIAKAGAVGMKSYQDAAQQQADIAGFGKALEGLGPDYDVFKQAYKAGMSPEAITGLLKGPVGEALQQQVQQQRFNEFVGPGGIKDLTPDRIWEGVGKGIFSPDQAFKYQEDLMKYNAELAKIQASGQGKISSNFSTFLATQGLTQQDLQNMSQPDRDNLTRGFEQMYNLGPGATTLKTVHNWETGNDDIVAVPAHPEAGRVVGQAKPPVGGNPIAMLGAVQTGMKTTLDLLKPFGDSNVPMQLPAKLVEKGITPSADYVHLSDQVGAVYTTLTTMIMRAGGFRNVAAAMDFMNTHVPRPGVDSPRTIRLKLEQWMDPGPNGLMNQYRQMLGNNMYAVPTAGGGLTGVQMPPPGGGGAGAEAPSDLEDVNPSD